MMRPGSREAKRMMERMGINSREFPEVKEVIFKTETKELLIRSPKVTAIEFQGQKIFQVIGGEMKEQVITSTNTTQETPKPRVPDEDVQLVAAQANVTLDQARRTLEETGGDLAQAILLLTSRKR